MGLDDILCQIMWQGMRLLTPQLTLRRSVRMRSYTGSVKVFRAADRRSDNREPARHKQKQAR